MYNSIECTDKYFKTSGSWQKFPFLDNNDVIADSPGDNNNSASFKYEIKMNRKWWYKKC